MRFVVRMYGVEGTACFSGRWFRALPASAIHTLTLMTGTGITSQL